MSYILDALRRADAERERGAVPNLHAQSVQTMEPDDEPRRKGKPMMWVVAGLSLALVASLAWQFLGREAARESVDASLGPGPANGMGAQPAAPLPSLPASPAPALPAVMTSPTAKVAAPAARNELPPVPAPAPAPRPALPPAPARASTAASEEKTSVTSAAISTTPLPTTPAASDNIRIPRQDELPEDIRRQLPKFVVGGSIYSESAASRFLILNGQIFHENDKVMPDLVLEQIKLKTAVLRYKNQRFSISY